MKSLKIYLLLVCTLASSAFAFNEDLNLIKRAYEDKLYLFVEERTLQHLKNPQFDNTSAVSQEIQYYLIGSYVQRGLYQNALNYIKKFETIDNILIGKESVQFFKAKALYYKYVENDDLEIFKTEKRPSEIITDILFHLKKRHHQYSAEALFIQGLDLFYIENFAEAKLVLRKLTEKYKTFKDLEEAKYYLARSYYYDTPPLYHLSLNLFNNLIKKHKRSERLAEYHFWKGECHFELNQISKAIESFNTAQKQRPSLVLESDIIYNLGWVHTGLGEYDKAKSYFNLLLTEKYTGVADRYVASAKYKLASIYMIQKDYKACLYELKDILDNDEIKDEASLLCAQTYMQLGNWIEAKKLLEIAVSSSLQEIKLEAGKSLSTVLFELKEYDEAIANLDSLTSMQVPLDYRVDILLQKAEIYYGAKKYYDAIGIYKDLMLENDPNIEAGLHYKLALCAMKTNPLVECFYDYEKLKKQKVSIDTPSDLEDLFERLSNVLTQMWTDATERNSELSNEDILDELNKFVQKDLVALEAEQLKIFKETNPEEDPKPLHRKSMLFVNLKNAFVEGFKSQSYGNYVEFMKKSPLLSEYYRSLQTVEILNHLDTIIRKGQENPYLALAYYEKAMLVKSQKLIEFTIENLSKAVQHTHDKALKSDYSFQLAHIRYEDAKNEVNTQSKVLKIQKTLEEIDQVEALGEIDPSDITYIRYSCYSLVTDFEKAESVLKNYINSAQDFDGLNRIEEQLISHYFKLDQILKAAKQKLHYAKRLELHEAYLMKAWQLSYEAAEIFIENDSTFDEGAQLLMKLSHVEETNVWTFKALLKSFYIYQKAKNDEEIEELITKLGQLKKLNEELEIEKQFLMGHYYVYKEQSQQAIKYFQWVMKAAVDYPRIRAKAYIECAKLLKNRDANRASNIFLEFYFLFQHHKKRELALFQGCRLKIKHLKQSSDHINEDNRNEVEKLVAKLESKDDQMKLINYLNQAKK